MAVDVSAPPPRPETRPRSGRLPLTGALPRARNWLEARALFVVGVAVVVLLSFAGIPSHLAQDGWLALVAGRIIAAHGIPSHDYLTVMAHGVRWTDQQWLAQLAIYEVERLGGLQLMTVAYVLLTGVAFALALAAARRLGAQDLHVLMVLPAGAFFYLATAGSIRTQGLAYPLFVAVLWLLASEFPRARDDVARPDPPARWRAYLVLPLLVLWANLHGSVTMGVGLAVIYGISLLLGGLARDGWRAVRSIRAWSFVLLPLLTPLATPYGTSIVHYYQVTLLNSDFGKLVTEWRPVSAYPVLAVPLFVLIAATLWVLWRSRGRTPLFDWLVLGMLVIGAIDAVRNITWFGVAVVVLLPAAVSRIRGDRPAPLRRARINLVFALTMLALTAGVGALTLARPTSWFETSYPHGALAQLRTLTRQDPSAKVFADVRYADWLVWEDPSLAGRIAYDTSLELLTPSQLAEIAKLNGGVHGDHLGLLGGYAIWMLNPGNRRADRELLAEPGVRTLTRGRRVILATHALAGSSS